MSGATLGTPGNQITVEDGYALAQEEVFARYVRDAFGEVAVGSRKDRAVRGLAASLARLRVEAVVSARAETERACRAAYAAECLRARATWERRRWRERAVWVCLTVGMVIYAVLWQ